MSEEPARVEGTSPARAGEAARELIRRTRQATRRKYPAEEKIRILLEGIRGEVSVSELCRREGIYPTIYYKWLKDFMEAGKGRLRGDTKREATTEEVRQLREENERLKQLVAELSLALSPTRKQSAAVTQPQPAANWSYRPFAEIEIGRDPRNLAAALNHLFLGD
jgi:transposase